MAVLVALVMFSILDRIVAIAMVMVIGTALVMARVASIGVVAVSAVAVVAVVAPALARLAGVAGPNGVARTMAFMFVFTSTWARSKGVAVSEVGAHRIDADHDRVGMIRVAGRDVAEGHFVDAALIHLAVAVIVDAVTHFNSPGMDQEVIVVTIDSRVNASLVVVQAIAISVLVRVETLIVRIRVAVEVEVEALTLVADKTRRDAVTKQRHRELNGQ
jgi:hypothetical protein